MVILRYGIFVSFGISLALLSYLVLHTWSFGWRRLHSRPQGRPGKGMVYALGRGMMPWEKESAAKHLPTYIAGMSYHAGIFSAILYVFLLAAGVGVSGLLLRFFKAMMAVGFLSGTGLLVKRIIKPSLRHISCADDFASNILVDLFILSGLFSSVLAAAVPVFFIIGILTAVNMPLGKIRHCFFFFYSRLLFGFYFGRRGVLPATPASKARS